MNVSRKYILSCYLFVWILVSTVPHELYAAQNQPWWKKTSAKVAAAVGVAVITLTSIGIYAGHRIHQRSLNEKLYQAGLSNWVIVPSLIEQGANLNGHTGDNDDGRTPFMGVFSGQNQETIEYALGHGANINATDYTGTTLLLGLLDPGVYPPIYPHYKIRNDARLDMQINFLLEHGADPNIQNVTGVRIGTRTDKTTALIQAIRFGYLNVARDLLQHGAKPYLMDEHRHDAFWYAEQTKNDQIIQLLETYRNKT